MATSSTGRSRCVICEKEKSAVRCEGCLQIFCRTHFNNHCEQLSQQLDEIELSRDLFRQSFNEQINDPEKHVLIRQIERWRKQSIDLIEKTAKQCREELLEHVNGHFKRIEGNLSKLTEEMRNVRKENDFNESDLKSLKEKLMKLEKDLETIGNVCLEHDSSAFIKKISVVVVR